MEQGIVHNHGPSEGSGLNCNEITLGEVRIGACLLRAKAMTEQEVNNAIFHQKE